MSRRPMSALVLVLAAGPLGATGEALIADYRDQGAGPFEASAGARAWVAEHRPPGAEAVRRCASCHLAFPARLLPAAGWDRPLGV